MKKNPVRHFFTNVVCGLIANKPRRKKVRVLLNSDVHSYVRFIRRDLSVPVKKIRTAIGYGAQNLIIIANDAYVYKFPLCKKNPNELALREKRIVDAFIPISPLPVPHVELLELDGIYVRKYPYIRGVTFGALSDVQVLANLDRWSRQIAEFMYILSKSNPAEIRDLRPEGMRRGLFCGWCHIDICGNFMINSETMDISAVIDWEDCRFGDFSSIFSSSLPYGNEFMRRVRDKYLELYRGGCN